MTSAKKNIVDLQHVSIGYQSRKKHTIIASDINVQLHKGTLVCLLGKNGIGKSTLLRSITNVQPVLSGEIYIKGTSIRKFSPAAFSKTISLVLTERLPESNLTVYEIVALGRQPYTNWIGTVTEADKNFIDKALNETNTHHLSDQKINELSDGQLQKVMIARAIAQDTELIILDEPTAHLDIHHKIETFSLLKKLAQEFGKTIIISTHEIQIALQLADELWLMKENSFTAGSTEVLIDNGSLTSLFSSQLITFDKNLKQFIIK